MTLGYIYIRSNEYWDNYNAFKLGKTTDIYNRDSTYITSEIKRGYFVMILEIRLDILDNVEKDLQKYFCSLGFHIKFDAGIEFFDKKIVNYIIPYLDNNNIEYKLLSKDKIDKIINKVLPKDYQIKIIDRTFDYFQYNNKGLLILPCGVGKTYISLYITKKLNYKSIIIGVPNILLLKQWHKTASNIFDNIPFLLISEGISSDTIKDFIINNKSCIIITTYASSYKVNKTNFIFDIKINDECHHLTSTNTESSDKNYIQMLKIKSLKQISLTATLKYLEGENNIISNDNKEYFGDIIIKKSLLWAINKNIVCDYVIQTIISNDILFEIKNENDRRMLLSAYSALLSIYNNQSHHILIYTNNRENTTKIVNFIQMLLQNNYFIINDLYYCNYHSEMKKNEQKNILEEYNNARYGILTNVYCLGEGYDNYLIDGVVFSENMSSNIRIVQSALRAGRKNKGEPNKITKIILPIVNNNDWLDINNSDFRKVREVIYQIGLEDETIIQKIKVMNINMEKKEKNIKEIKEIEYDYKLTEELKLKTVNRTALGITYEKARKIISEKNIKNKKEYYELCDKDSRLTKEPEINYKGSFTNWIDYLSIHKIYYDIETCKNKINEYILLYSDIKKDYLNLDKIVNKLCEIDKNFPPNDLWIDYYNIKDLIEIINITNKKKKTVNI